MVSGVMQVKIIPLFDAYTSQKKKWQKQRWKVVVSTITLVTDGALPCLLNQSTAQKHQQYEGNQTDSVGTIGWLNLSSTTEK